MLVMIDNYDSFTYNLVQYFGELGEEVRVYRNDEVDLERLQGLRPERIVISPGPGDVGDGGISTDVIRHFAGRVPVLGVCLGHQCLAAAYGGRTVRAREVMHGKPSLVHHLGTDLFRGLPSPFEVTRYHSLVVDPQTLGEELEVTAWTAGRGGRRDEIMGLRHKRLALSGVQFHPESIFTAHGHALLQNFLATVEGESAAG